MKQMQDFDTQKQKSSTELLEDISIKILFTKHPLNTDFFMLEAQRKCRASAALDCNCNCGDCCLCVQAVDEFSLWPLTFSLFLLSFGSNALKH